MLIDELLAQDESKTLEFKRDLSSLDSVVREIVSFANSAGGLLVVGVDDDKTVVGITDFQKLEEKLINAVSSTIEPQILINPRSTSHDGKELMIVEVVQAPQRPVYIKKLGPEKGTYVRIGSEKRVADAARLEELRSFHANRTWDEQPCPGAKREDFDDALAERLFAQRDEPFNDAAMRTNRLLVDSNLGLVPSRAGVILFAADPREHFPDARFRCITYDGPTKTTDARDPVDFEGQTILESLEEVVQYVLRHTGVRTSVPGMVREEFWEYSLPVLREVLHNAIGHADYNMDGRRLNISIYSDRIEIENPGTFPPGMTLDDLKDGVGSLPVGLLTATG